MVKIWDLADHEEWFEATHEIPGLPGWHPCARPHGHHWVVDFVMEPAAGVVVDPGELDRMKVWTVDRLRMRHLNDVLPDGVAPTQEHLAIWIHEQLSPTHPTLAAVGVRSGDDHRTEYRPNRAGRAGQPSWRRPATY